MAVPPEHFVWGLINNQADLISNSMAFSDFCKIDGDLVQGNLVFEGEGPRFVTAFRERINHILEANGAFFDGTANRGHAQRNQRISFNTIQPYPDCDLEGLYPTIIIQP
jgi:hypothetical protein